MHRIGFLFFCFFSRICFAQHSGEEQWIIFSENDKYGYQDTSQHVMLGAKFDLLGHFDHGLAPALLDSVYGFINPKGNFVLKIRYRLREEYNEISGERWLDGFSNGRCVVIRNGIYGFINTKGKLVTPFMYQDTWGFSENMANVKMKDRWGYIDTSGYLVVSPIYQEAWKFSCGRAAVKQNDKFGFIDNAGKVVIPIGYSSVFTFSEDRTWVSKGDYSYMLVDQDGKIINAGPYEMPRFFEQGKAAVIYKGDCMEIDRSGKKLRDLQEDECAGD